MIRRTTTELVLDYLQDRWEGSTELFHMMMAPRPESYRRARRLLAGFKNLEPGERWSEIHRDQKNFCSLLSKLKKEGLVTTKIKNGKFIWRTALKGRAYLGRKKDDLPKFIPDHKKKNDSRVVIVSYDIPEVSKRERSWLRDCLKILKFEMIHKSVWLGNQPIPEELINLFKKRSILNFIHIFEVSKTGSLKRVET